MRSKNKKWTDKEYKQTINKRFSHIKVLGKFKTVTDAIKHRCVKHKKSFMCKPYQILRTKFGSCPDCIKESINQSRNVSKKPKIKWDTDKYNDALIKVNNLIICTEEYTTYKDILEHSCIKHGTFFTSPSNALKIRNKFICIKCNIEWNARNRTNSQETILLRIFNKHGNKVLLQEDYKGIDYAHKFKCDKDHEWSTSMDSIINQGTGCPHCCTHKHYSTIERRWISFMKRKINPDILTLDDEILKICLPEYKRSIRPDGYDPKTKTVYEFHGDYWHGNLRTKQQYSLGDLSKKDLNRKTRKREKALLRAGYKVVYCWEMDFKRYLKGRFYFRPLPYTVAKLNKSPYCY